MDLLTQLRQQRQEIFQQMAEATQPLFAAHPELANCLMNVPREAEALDAAIRVLEQGGGMYGQQMPYQPEFLILPIV